jgi:3-oxoacyl-[acyl-carrier protein] reductase
MSDLAGKVALVTGASRGIGAEIARTLARHGAAVAFTYRSAADQAHGVEKAIQSDGGRALAVQADNADPEAVRAAVEAAVAEFGGLDILVNNAADTGRGDLEHIAVARWDTIMAVNLRAPFILLQESIAPMRARGGGSIVNIGSILAYVGEPKLGAY